MGERVTACSAGRKWLWILHVVCLDLETYGALLARPDNGLWAASWQD
jgi:hypothetical protein